MDFGHLSADTAHRFREVGELVDGYGRQIASTNPRLLDVGGYPGTFARAVVANLPHWRATTVDMKDDNLPDYVTASGAKLPFPDRIFDAVTTIDTLEHVPAKHRADFLGELCRVSSDLVIIAAPFHHPAVAGVEKLLGSAHEKAFGAPHPWLDEHIRFGLPHLPAILKAIPDSHRVTLVYRSFGLEAWMHWQFLSLFSKLRSELDVTWKAWDSAFAAGDTPEASPVPYRWLIVARRGDPTSPFNEFDIPEDAAGASIVTQARLYAAMLELMSIDSNRGGSQGGKLMIEERLKDVIRAQEKQLEQHAHRDAPRAGPPENQSTVGRLSGMIKKLRS